MHHDQILDLGRRWADAERRADVAALDTHLADDFVLVGPPIGQRAARER